MDELGGLLDGPRARGAFLLRAIMDPPWSIRIQDEAPLCLIAVVRGTAWLASDDRPPRQLGPGDLAVARGPDHYTVADDPASTPQIVIHPGQRCTTPDGRELADELDLGVRTWGNSRNGETVMLIGAYERPSEISRRLLLALPPWIVLTGDSWNNPLVTLLSEEIVKDEPGQEVVLDRLLDLLLIGTLRTWFARPDAKAPAWYAAYSHPVVGRALRLLHNNPARPWTVASLATETGTSRAGLARQFTELVGEPPMAYLTTWRLSLAADLLRDPDTTIGAVATRVGYSNAFALSAAFKRVRGISPKEHRARAGA